MTESLSDLNFAHHLAELEWLAAEPCTLVMLDGTEIAGTLHAYDERGGTIRYSPEGIEVRQVLRLDLLRMLRLERPVHPGEADAHFLKRNIATHAIRKRLPFTLTYSDSRTFSGELLGYSFSSGGLGLYLASNNDLATRCFFPYSAIDDFTIGHPLGRVLLDRGHLTERDLERALAAQRTLRSQRIGDILSEKRAINREALEEALRQQSSRPHSRIGQVLLEMGVITAEQLTAALEEQKRRHGQRLGAVLIEMGLLDASQIKDAIAEKLGFPHVDLTRFRVERDAFESVPAQTLLEHRVAPLYRTKNALVVAIANPFNAGALKAVAFAAQTRIVPVLASAEEIDAVLGRHRPDGITLWQHATEGEHVKYLS